MADSLQSIRDKYLGKRSGDGSKKEVEIDNRQADLQAIREKYMPSDGGVSRYSSYVQKNSPVQSPLSMQARPVEQPSNTTNFLLQLAQGMAAPQFGATVGTDIRNAAYAADLSRERKAEENRRIVEESSKLVNNPDFAENSGYVSTYKPGDGTRHSDTYGDFLYEYVNRNPQIQNTVRDEINVGANQKYGYVTDEQRSIYNYLYKTQGREEAEKYLYALDEKDMNAAMAEELSKQAREFAKEEPVNATLQSFADSAFSSVADAPRMALSYLSGNGIDPNADYMLSNRLSGEVRGQVSNDIENAFGDSAIGKAAGWTTARLYQAVASNIDSRLRLAMGAGSEAAALVFAGMGAGVGAAEEAKQRGYSDGQAMLHGTIVGLIEAATEKLGYDALFGHQAGESLLESIAKQAAPEALEEATATVADYFADALIGGEKSQFVESMNKYRAEGYSEFGSVLKTLGDLGLDAAEDAFVGGLAGGLSGTSVYVANQTGLRSLGNEFRQNYNHDALAQLAQEGMYNDENTAAYKSSERLNAELEKGRNPSASQIGRVIYDQSVENEQDRNGQEAIATAIQHLQDNNAITRADIKSIKKNTYAIQELQTVSPDMKTTASGITEAVKAYKAANEENSLSEDRQFLRDATGYGITSNETQSAVQKRFGTDIDTFVESAARITDTVEAEHPELANTIRFAYNDIVNNSVERQMLSGEDFAATMIKAYNLGQEGKSAISLTKDMPQIAAAYVTQAQRLGVKEGEINGRINGDNDIQVRTDSNASAVAGSGMEAEGRRENGSTGAGREAYLSADPGETEPLAEVSNKQIFGDIGGEGNVRIVKPSKEFIKAAREVAKASGFTGTMHFTDRVMTANEGKGDFAVDGWISSDNKHIYANLHPAGNKTAMQTIIHELAHFEVRDDKTAVRAFRDNISKDKELADLIERGYKMLYDTDSSARAWEEAYCDAKAEINAFTGSYKLQETAKAVSEKKGKIQTALTEAQNPRAPTQPSMTKAQAAAALNGDSIDGFESFSRASFSDALGITATSDGDYYFDGKLLNNLKGAKLNTAIDQIVDQSRLFKLVQFAKANQYISQEDVDAQKMFIGELMKSLITQRDASMVYAFSGSMLWSGIKENADKQYKKTIDFEAICKKTEQMVASMSEAMVRKGRGLTLEEITRLYDQVVQAGETTPCPACYVFSRWIGLGGLLDNIKSYQTRYADSTEADLNRGRDKVGRRVEAYRRTDENFGKARSRLVNDLAKKADKITQQYNTLLSNGASKAELDAKLKEHKAVVDDLTEVRSYEWIEKVRKKKNYKPVPDNVLFNLTAGEEFASKYPDTWAFRTSQGAGYGKAITPYADARIGDIIQGIHKGVKSIKTGTNSPFVTMGDTLTSKQRSELTAAINAVKQQNMRGGVRMQSVSDFRYEFALDYIQAFFELEAIGAGIQTYTKVVEFVPLISSVGGFVNMSLMPAGNGIKNGKLVYSSTIGIDYDTAIDLQKEYDTAGTILMSVSDEHTILAMADDNIYFIIPYHRSGGRSDVIESMLSSLGETQGNYDSYEDVQSEGFPKTDDENALLKLRNKILRGNTRLTLTEAEQKLLATNQYLSSIYDRKYNQPNDPLYHVQLTATDTKQIFPYEYWDTTSTFKTADINGQRYLEYCEALGVTPKFSGNRSGKHDFRQYPGYWKLLIDRRMYGNNGQYLPLTSINASGLNMSQLDQQAARKRFGDAMSKRADLAKTQEIVDKAFPETAGRFSRPPVVHVEVNQDLIDRINNSDKSISKELTAYLKETYAGVTFNLSDGDTAIIDGRDASELANNAGTRRVRQVSGLKELVETAVYDHSDDSPVHRKFDRFKYYYVTAEIGGNEYDLEVNVGRAKNDKSNHVYRLIERTPTSNGVSRLPGNADSIEIPSILSDKRVPQESLAVKQEISSAGTSIMQIPALFKDSRVQFGKTNIDIGGGKYDLATNYLKERGTTNMVFDPYNRDEATNQRVIDFLQSGKKADTATCANVLNVIAEKEARENVILEVAKAIKPDGTAYFMVYEGDGSGNGRETKAGYQNNLKTAEYVSEISEYFDDVRRQGKLITAKEPKANLPAAVWEVSPGKGQRFSRSTAPEFYSKLERDVEGYKGDKIGAASVISYLKGKGVKDEEIKWTGIATFLEGKKSVSKADLLQYIRDNQIQIEEQVLDTEYDSNSFDDYEKAEEETYNAAIKLLKERGEDVKRNNLYVDYDADSGFTAYRRSNDEAIYTYDPEKSRTHWKDYKTPGGENYREILYKLPGSDYSNLSMETHWGEKGVLAHARIQDFETGDGKILFVDEIQSDWHNAGEKNGYGKDRKSELREQYQKEISDLREEQSQHEEWRKEHLDAITDAEDRIAGVTNLDGWKVYRYLTLGEDRYLEDAEVAKINSVVTKEEKQLFDENGKNTRRQNDIAERINTLTRRLGHIPTVSSVPDAPFRNGNYVQYVLKDLLRKAAEGGYDYLSWTTGKMQEDRWSDAYAEGYRIEYDQDIPKFLSKYGKQWGAKLTQLTLSENGEEIDNFKKQIDEFYDLWSRVDPYDLEKEQILDGLGLHSDGIDASIEDIRDAGLSEEEIERMRAIAWSLDTAYEDGLISKEILEGPTVGDVPAIPITDAMRESVMYQGQARFARGSDIDQMQLFTDDLKAQYAALQAEVQKQTERAEYFKGETRLKLEKEGADRYQVSDTGLTKIEQKLKKDYSSNASIRDDLRTLINDFMNGRTDYDGAFNMAMYIGNHIVAEAKELVSPDDHVYRELRDYLRKTRISINASAKSDIADYEAFRRRNLNRIRLVNDGLPIDVAYQELQEMFGKSYFPDVIDTQSDQLMQIDDVLRTLTPVFENPYTSTSDAEMAVEAVAMDIMQTLMNSDEIDKVAPTFADRQKREREKAVAKAKDQVRYYYEGRLTSLRNSKDKRIQELKDSAQRLRDRRKDSEMRTKLLNIARRLQNRKLPAVQRQRLDEIIGDLDTVAKGITGRSIQNLTALRDWYEDRKQNDPDFLSDKATEERIARLEKRHIADMTQEEVLQLTQVLQFIENEIAYEKKLIDDQDRRDTYQLAEAAINDIRGTQGTRLGLVQKADGFFVMGALSGERAVRRMTGYVDDDPLYQLTKKLSDGQRTMLDFQRRASHMVQRFTEDRAFVESISGKKAKPIRISGVMNGERVEVDITPAERISLYLHSKNDANLYHIEYGGITVPDFKLLTEGKIEEAYNESKAKTIKLKPSEVRAITAQMSGKERAFADAISDYFNGMSQKEINDVSEKLKGYSLAQVENYFPIETNKNFLKRDYESLQMDGTIEGMGFLKERVQKASTPIMLREAQQTMNQSVRMTSKYIGLAIPVRNFGKVMKVDLVNWVGGEADLHQGTIKQAIDAKWGKTGNDYLEKLIADLQNPYHDEDALGSLANKITSNYAGAVLELNAGVAIKQAASYPTAMAIVGARPLVQALGDFNSVDVRTIEKYTPLLWYRSQGYSTTELGDMASGVSKNVPTWLKWIQHVDIATTKKLWRAAEIYVQQNDKQNLRLGSEEFYQEVARVYNRIIEETQPNYTVMQRPGLLRSKNAITRALNMFKTQPYQNFGILFDAVQNFKAKQTQFQTMRSSEAEFALKQARKQLADAVVSQLLSALVFAAMQGLWDVLRGKTDKYKDKAGEATVGSLAKGFGLNILSNGFGMIPLGSVGLELIESTTDKVAKALGGDAVFNQSFYGMDVPVIETMNGLMEGMGTVMSTLAGALHDAATGDEVDGWETLRKIYKASSEGFQAAGLPVQNVVSLLNAVAQNGAKLFNSIGGNYYMGNYASLRIQGASNTQMYQNLYQAYKNNRGAYQELYNQMIEDGYSEKAIKNFFKKME